MRFCSESLFSSVWMAAHSWQSGGYLRPKNSRSTPCGACSSLRRILRRGAFDVEDLASIEVDAHRDNARRRECELAELPLDENFLAAMKRGLPECSGVALGIERLLMAMSGSEDIRDVLAFGFADA